VLGEDPLNHGRILSNRFLSTLVASQLASVFGGIGGLAIGGISDGWQASPTERRNNNWKMVFS
jgi:hypothetical protein